MTRKTLYIKATPHYESDSFSAAIGRAFLDEYRAGHPESDIIELDICESQVPAIDSEILEIWKKMQSESSDKGLSQYEKDKMKKLGDFTEQFASADDYIFISTIEKTGIPAQLVLFLETILLAGHTFKKTLQGPVGLLTGKKGFVLQIRMDMPEEGSESQPAVCIGETHVRDIMTLMGVEMTPFLIAEDKNLLSDDKKNTLMLEVEQVREAAREFASAG